MVPTLRFQHYVRSPVCDAIASGRLVRTAELKGSFAVSQTRPLLIHQHQVFLLGSGVCAAIAMVSHTDTFANRSVLACACVSAAYYGKFDRLDHAGAGDLRLAGSENRRGSS